MFIGISLALSQFRPVLPPSWAPADAAEAWNFVSNEYWRRGTGIIANPLTVTRSTKACRTSADGVTITEFAVNTLRRDSRGAYIEGYARKRMSLQPLSPVDWAASAVPGLVESSGGAAIGSFAAPLIGARPVGGGSFTAWRDTTPGFAILAGQRLSSQCYFEFGTSARVRNVVRQISIGGNNSIMSGAQGTIASGTAALGTYVPLALVDIGAASKKLTGYLVITLPGGTPINDADWEVGPDAASDGGNIKFLGGQLTLENYPGEMIIDTPTAQFTQAAETVVATISGLKTISVDFDLISLPSGASSNEIWHYGDASDFTRLLYETSTGKLLAQAYAGGVQQCSLDLGTVTITAPHTVDFSWATNDFAASIDGGAEVTDTSGTAPTGMTSFILGQDAAAANGTGFNIRSAYFFDRTV